MAAAVVHERRASVLGIAVGVVVRGLISVGDHRDQRLCHLAVDGREAEQQEADDDQTQHFTQRA